jgi:hypothetical protein
VTTTGRCGILDETGPGWRWYSDRLRAGRPERVAASSRLSPTARQLRESLSDTHDLVAAYSRTSLPPGSRQGKGAISGGPHLVQSALEQGLRGPGVLALLLMVITSVLTAMAIVGEKELAPTSS